MSASPVIHLPPETNMEALKCPSCGAPVAGPASTCTYCGTTLTPAAVSPGVSPGAASPAGAPAGYPAGGHAGGGQFDVLLEGVHPGAVPALTQAIIQVAGLAPPIVQRLLAERPVVVHELSKAAADQLAAIAIQNGVNARLMPARAGRPAGPPGWDGPGRGGPGRGGPGRGGPGRGGPGPGWGGPPGRRGRF